VPPSDVVKCKYNILHWILKPGTLEDHYLNCPNKGAPEEDPALRLKRIREQATDLTPTGILNRNHGLVPAEAYQPSMPTKVPKLREEEVFEFNPLLQSQKLMIHLSSFAFSVVKHEIKAVRELHLYIDNFTNADKEHYPGLRKLEETRSHHLYLVAYLWEDSSDPTSVNMYKKLCATLQKQQTGMPISSIGVCNNCAGSDNLVYLIVHKTETSGFGGRIDKSEIGLFCMPSTLLYGRTDSTQALKESLSQTQLELTRCQSLYADLLRVNSDEKAEINRLNHTLSSQEKQFWATMMQKDADFNSKIERYKAETSQALAAYKETAKQSTEQSESRLKQTLGELERVRQEKLTILHNAQSEMNDKQRLTERVAELEKLLKNKDKQSQKLSQAIKKKGDEYAASLRKLTESNQKYFQELEAQRRQVETAKASVCAQERQHEDRELCMFCMDRTKNTVFVPCGHVTYCTECIEHQLHLRINSKVPENHQNKECPLCKEEIQRVNLCFAY